MICRSTHLGPQSGAAGLRMIAGFALLVALGLGWWYASDASRAETLVDSDRVVTAQRKTVIDAVTASGRVEPITRVAVMSRASGIIKELFVDEGDFVKKGQVLAELDREQLEAQLSQARADKLAAQARLDAALARVAEVRVRIADPEVDFLKREAERLVELSKQGHASPSERDAAQRAVAVAEFRVEQAEASLPVLQASVEEARAGLASSEADLEQSETAMREATIICPIDGVVILRDKEVGDGVSSILTAGGNATQIMTLADVSKMHIEARVDEVDLGRIQVAMAALITVDAYRGRVLEGSVQRIAPAGSIDENGIVTFEVRIAVQDPDQILKPDMTADAKLVIDRRDSVVVLPQTALSQDEEGAWVVDRIVERGDEPSLERVTVEVGLSDGLMTEIRSGLDEGDRVMLPASPFSQRG